ncbi:MAG: hypothetical protein HYZ57_07810 [Acidobacteria bacterium]|nr:hypothetical protein [Acidobacteriota bacterium]MBI3279728.1 hypothetical protein [Acidobacteriota bacterium]
MKAKGGLLHLTAGVWLAGCAACQNVVKSNDTPQRASAKAPAGWGTHQDAQGFSVQLPAGWKVRGDQASGRVELRGLNREEVIIWPVVLRQGSFDMASASEALRRAAGKLWQDTSWGQPQPAGSTTVLLRGRSGDRPAVSILTWIASPVVTVGYLYGVTAPKPVFDQPDVLSAILESFRLRGSSAPASGMQNPSLEYIRWQDPRENSFSVEVPKGWRVNGGLFRFSVIDIRGAMELSSPDGQIRITAGDAEVPIFMEPFSYLGINYPEGTWYRAGYGNNYYMRRYVPGTPFAREYAQTKLAKGCSGLAFSHEGTRNRDDTVRAMNAVLTEWSSLGIYASLTAGETAFTCASGGQMLQGYYFASTGLARTQVGNWWRPQYFFGYVASGGNVWLAQAVLEQMLRSYQVNPVWVRMQSEAIGRSAGIVARTNQEISGIINDAYRNRVASQDRIWRMAANARRGVEEWEDRQTGRQMTLESGSNYYWVDNRGTIAGTTTSTSPSVDFRQLVRLP